MSYNEAKDRIALLQQYMKSVQAEISLIESDCSAQMLESLAAYPVIPNSRDAFLNSLQFPLKPQLLPYVEVISSIAVDSGSTKENFSAESETQVVDDIDHSTPQRRGRSYSSASSKSNKHSDNEGDGNEPSAEATSRTDASTIKYTYGKNSKKVSVASQYSLLHVIGMQ